MAVHRSQDGKNAPGKLAGAFGWWDGGGAEGSWRGLTLWGQCRRRERAADAWTIEEKVARREQRFFPNVGPLLLAVLSWRIPCTN